MIETHIKHWRGIMIEKPKCDVISKKAFLPHTLGTHKRSEEDFCEWKSYRSDVTVNLYRDTHLYVWKNRLYGRD